MQHLILAVVTMGTVWVAWRSFKQLGRVKATDADLTTEERQRQQMRYGMRIVLCLVVLAVLPFLFTMITHG
ncbi:MAG: hypothetical protein J0I17_11845 ['Candidatus Kapabacteria' thiocyanatum]|uniref:Uncharacterized protein n=1 Tax=Candidatus Kapaibacterium thiocyanatum TaxID=1895771 RepID=A0A1M3L321_9BACT|nr:hypothetical protein ['Candidatus Kapabacteria' thiocyanatum]OJX59692.1 MAG: hypothetical protein BGO89_05600 ['Candidatus Kapabacteria' thiocyanatum]